MLRKQLVKHVPRHRHVPITLGSFSSFFEQLQLESLFFLFLFPLDCSQVLLHLANLLLSGLKHVLVGVNLLVQLHKLILVCAKLLFKSVDLSVKCVIRTNYVVKLLIQPDVDLSLLINLLLDQIDRIFSSKDVLTSSGHSDVLLLQAIKLTNHLAHVVQPLANSPFIVCYKMLQICLQSLQLVFVNFALNLRFNL